MNFNIFARSIFNTESDPVAFTQQFITPPEEALTELHRRQTDTALKEKVEQFLNTDIPAHFNNGPILYLSRHVATPSYATLRFIELSKPFNMPIVIGEDKNDIFVSNNSLKRALGKLPIVKGVTRNSDEIIEFFTIIDFAEAQGKQFKNINTLFGQNLIEFHTHLLKDLYPYGIQIIDESDWVDTHDRGNLLEHYKKILSLLIVHGVMFEWYEPEDYIFVKQILAPAFKFVEETFGVRPLICNIVEPEIENLRDWNSYPSVIYRTVKNSCEKII